MLVKFIVHKSRLHECLTVVEDTIYLDSGDILAQRSELALLNGADLALGVEHIDVDALYTKETIGYGATGITGGGHEDVDGLVACRIAATQEVAKQTGHKARTNILEGKGGTME